MAFNSKAAQTRTRTFEGARAFTRTPQDELYLMVATSLFSGDSFYETDADRLTRFRAKVAEVAARAGGPAFLTALTAYAREVLHLRTTPTMLATEMFLHALEGAEDAAKYAWVRGDEHLEALAYVKAVGAKYPKRFLKAVGARLNALTERQALRYAGTGKAFSQRDALRIAHPRTADARQNALYKFIVDGYGELSSEQAAALPLVTASRAEGEALSWENLISKQGSSTATWEAAVPLMGYMALLRNLRNLVQHSVPAATLEAVAHTLADPEAVRASRQMPYRFYSAYKALPQGTPAVLLNALSSAMDVAAGSAPVLDGETLVLIDLSGSMVAPLSARSEVTRLQAACALGAMLGRRKGMDVWAFAVQNRQVRLPQGTPTLIGTEKIEQLYAELGGGTYLADALTAALKREYRRIVILTDEQCADNAWGVLGKYLDRHTDSSVYLVNLVGYAPSAVSARHPRVHTVGGFSDRVLEWIGAMEQENAVQKILAYAARKEAETA